MKKKILYLCITVILILLDQFTKSMAVKFVKGKENVVWLKNVFELEYCENTGAAFSSFTGKQIFLLTVTVLVLLFVLFEFFRIPDEKKYGMLRFDFALLVAGALGNMIDRVKQGYVVDFFYFVPINFPRFNVADCYITVAAIILGILILFVYKDEDVAFLFNFKKHK